MGDFNGRMGFILGLVGLIFGLEGFLDFLEKVTRKKEENEKKKDHIFLKIVVNKSWKYTFEWVSRFENWPKSWLFCGFGRFFDRQKVVIVIEVVVIGNVIV